MEDIYKRISNDDDFGADDTEQSEIQNFYAGQTIFLTGSTGFLGKCLFEKLLRDCPGIKKIYLMIRPSNRPVKERMDKYFKHIFFDKLRKLQPNFRSKVVIIEGDLMKEGMGLNEEDRNILINEITIIIHNASNVKFEDRISNLFRCNVWGTKYMIDLAKQCKNLKLFSYISTAYSHCYRRVIEEKCYSPPADLKVIQDFIDADENTSSGITSVARNNAMKPWINAYTYTKSTAESLIEQLAKEIDFACVIIRPSIIIPTYLEPIAAWCGNINGPALLFLGGGLGVIHVAPECNFPVDFIPADMCANGILAIIWDVLTYRKDNIGNVMVFNYGSSTVNPISMKQLEAAAFSRGVESPSIKMIGPYFRVFTGSFISFIIFHLFLHFIPALIADIVLILTFRKPLATAICWKFTMYISTILFFCDGNWRIHVHEMQKVWDRMNHRDRHLFFTDLRLLDWSMYAYSFWGGLRIFILKDPISTAPAGVRRYKILQIPVKIIKAFTHIYIAYHVFTYWMNIVSPVTLYALRKLCETYC